VPCRGLESLFGAATRQATHAKYLVSGTAGQARKFAGTGVNTPLVETTNDGQTGDCPTQNEAGHKSASRKFVGALRRLLLVASDAVTPNRVATVGKY